MRKVFKNGNSLAVTVPKIYAHQLNIRDGSKIEWELRDEGILLKRELQTKSSQEIDPAVAKLIKKLSKKYSGVWEELAKV